LHSRTVTLTKRVEAIPAMSDVEASVRAGLNKLYTEIPCMPLMGTSNPNYAICCDEAEVSSQRLAPGSQPRLVHTLRLKPLASFAFHYVATARFPLHMGLFVPVLIRF
jgi:hypothetical protein